MLLQYSSDVMQLALSTLDSTVTVRLKLPHCLLQNFECSTVSQNPSQASHREKGAALVRHHYEIIDHTVRVYCCITDCHENAKAWPDQSCYDISLLCSFHYLCPMWSPQFESLIWNVYWSSEEITCKQACPKIPFWTKEHLRTATYWYNKKGNFNLRWKWPNELQGLNVENNYTFELLNPFELYKFYYRNFDLI